MKKLAKVLAVLGIIVGLLSIGANVFAYVENIPDYELFMRDAADPLKEEAGIYSMLLDKVGEKVRTMSYIALGTGAVAVLFGLIGVLKVKKGWAAAGLVLGLLGAGGQFVWAAKGEQHLVAATQEQYLASQKEAVEIVKKNEGNCGAMQSALAEHAKKAWHPNSRYMKEQKGSAAFKEFKDKEIWPLLEVSLPILGKCRDQSPDIVRVYEHILVIRLTKE